MGEISTDVENLPELAADVVNAFHDAGRLLAVHASEQFLATDRHRRSSPLLRGGTFRWNLRIAKEKEKVVLFLIRKQLPDVPVMNAHVRFNVAAVAPGDIGMRGDAVLPEVNFYPPPAIIVPPSPQYVRDVTGDDSATPENTLLLRSGWERVVAVVWGGGSKKRPRIYEKRGAESPEPVEPSGEQWPLAPFVGVVETLAAWARGDAEPTESRLLDVTGSDSDVERVIGTIVRCFHNARHRSTIDDLPHVAPWMSSIWPVYDVPQLDADLMFRLDAEGNLSGKFGEASFQLRVRLRLTGDGARCRGRVDADVPDFLIGGDRLRSLVDALRTQDALEQLTAQLSKTELGKHLETSGAPLTPQQVSAILDRAAARSIVFRTNRKAHDNRRRTDTDLFAMRVSAAGASRFMLFRAKFRITRDEAGEDSTEFRKDSVRVIHFGAEDGAGSFLEDDDVAYFRRLARALHRWMGVLT